MPMLGLPLALKCWNPWVAAAGCVVRAPSVSVHECSCVRCMHNCACARASVQQSMDGGLHFHSKLVGRTATEMIMPVPGFPVQGAVETLPAKRRQLVVGAPGTAAAHVAELAVNWQW